MPTLTRLGLRLPAAFDATRPGPLLPRLAELALAAETAGFDSLWVPDGAGPPGADPATVVEAYTTLGALALVTTTARLGALASPVHRRPPSLVAKQLTTVDVLSGGRAVLGLQVVGRRLTGRRPQLERLDEAVQVCRALFCHELSTFAGRHFGLENAANRPPPVQVGGPPVLVAGPGGRGLLAVAARRADAVFVPVGPASLRRRVATVAELARGAGRGPTEVSVIAGLAAAPSLWETGDVSPLVARARTLRRAGAHGVIVEASANVRPGMLERLGQALRDLA